MSKATSVFPMIYFMIKAAIFDEKLSDFDDKVTELNAWMIKSKIGQARDWITVKGIFTRTELLKPNLLKISLLFGDTSVFNSKGIPRRS